MSDEDLPSNDLLQYFMATTDARLSAIEGKLDRLMQMRAQLLMISGVVSACASAIVAYVVSR